MSALYGSMQGSRGQVTRQGHTELTAHLRGWSCGVEVDAQVLSDGRQTFTTYRTGGSNGGMGGRVPVSRVTYLGSDCEPVTEFWAVGAQEWRTTLQS